MDAIHLVSIFLLNKESWNSRHDSRLYKEANAARRKGWRDDSHGGGGKASFCGVGLTEDSSGRVVTGETGLTHTRTT